VVTKAIASVKQEIVVNTVKSYTVKWFGEDEWQAMHEVIMRESGFNLFAVNKSSGACGIGQALPCSKLNCEMSDAACQAEWVVNYIKQRYGTPSAALWFHNSHNWY
jgi:hypothetical protein